MIKTTAMILDELRDYSSPKDKLARLSKKGVYIPIVRGLYETDRNINPYLLAGVISSPSYISFEFALSYYGFIPERVEVITSASFDKKKKKFYETNFGLFTYKDVPKKAFPYSVNVVEESGYYYKIASPEKAICDKLYDEKPLANQKELLYLLEEDLRFDMDMVLGLDVKVIDQLSELYGSTNVRKFSKLIRRLKYE